MLRVLQRSQASFFTDFAAACPSVTHSWILSLLEKTELPDFICHYLRSIYRESTTHVELAGATRGQLRMSRVSDKDAQRAAFSSKWHLTKYSGAFKKR